MLPSPSEAVKPIPRWERLRATLIRLRKPLLVVAGVGTVLGGLAGYLNAWRAVRSEALAVAAAGPMAAAAPALSLLVLPLANQTGEAAKAYVADGLTTAITDDLGRLPDIVVVPPLMAVGLQERGLTLQQLGAQAGVRFVLQGAVLASGARLRVNAQLHDTRGGAQLWSTTFEGSLQDLFALQDDITARIRGAIEPTMVMTAARESDKRAATPDLADLLIRARALGLRDQSGARLREMEAIYRKALLLSADEPRALSGLAGVLWLQATNYQSEFDIKGEAQRNAQVAKAAALARRALAIDPTLIAPRHVLSHNAWFAGDAEGALAAMHGALALDPRRSSTLNNLGVLYRDLGELDRALDYFLQAHRVPAFQPASGTLQNLSRTTMTLGRLDEAVAWAQRGVEVDPESDGMHAQLATALAMRGDVPGARKAAATAVRINPKFDFRIDEDRPWPGRETAYRDYVETRLRPAVRLAGLPDSSMPATDLPLTPSR